MRTNVTLDPDVESLIRTAMHEKAIGFKQAVNEAIRAVLLQQPRIHSASVRSRWVSDTGSTTTERWKPPRR